MRLIFRVDASRELGTGHVMRTSAVIEEAVLRGIRCIVVGSLGGLAWLEERLINVGAGHFEDPVQFQIDHGKDILVIDSYELPINDSFIQPHRWKSVVSISDHVTPKYLADLVIHPGIDQVFRPGGDSKFLTGPDFVPFRKSIRKSSGPDYDSVDKIVVFAGGADKFGFGSAMSTGLAKLPDFQTAIFFSNSHDGIVQLDPRFELRDIGLTLDKELETADLVFSTASTSSLEIVARELPLAVCFTVENQVPYFDALVNQGLAQGIGGIDSRGNWKLDWDSVSRFISDSRVRRKLLSNSSGYFDLLGSKRIVDEILKL
jgi:spore coat polysaccharide biosynthesis predicted glycosyltransferase SpsG